VSPARVPRLSVASIHADWLRLVEPNGPFLTVPVLRRVWPNGLDHVDTDRRAEVRRHFADLDVDDRASVTTWTEWVMSDLLAYGNRLRAGPEISATLAHVVAEHGVVLRPDYVLDNGDGRARLLITTLPASTRLDSRPSGDRWSATPIERLILLCRATGVEIGLATNGTAWVLVRAPKTGASGSATFSADLFSEEPALLDAFTSVLGARRFFAVPGPDRLEALFGESASAQAEVTGKLGQQVRQAVELLVAAISRADRDRNGELLENIEPGQVYAASVAVLMRMVLLLYSEERSLLPLGDDFYDQTLAASTLLDQLREIQAETGDEPLERSHTAWYRLLALFRAVHSGINHDRLRIPAYGGALFDPDRYPFLEGRRTGEHWLDTASVPIPVDDLTVLAVLSALQELRFTERGVTETRRLTYRALDVEQIGYVYEGLLDHSAVSVDTTAVGLVGKPGLEPEISLDDLAHHSAQGYEAFVDWLVDITGLTTSRIDRLLNSDIDAHISRLLRAACDNDETLTATLTPYAGLLRRDLRGLPTVFPAGSKYVTQIGAKRDTGTAYTTKELAEEVAEHALAPIVYSPGPADGANPTDWKLRTSAELLELKVCDPAVGSGAILVAACRYLADRLLEAWITEGAPQAEGDPDDVRVQARRAVADRCLYGVDRDPMAVEMAKLSLWLVTLSKERPFNFLDHALKAGDSLLGITSLDQLRALHFDPGLGRAKVPLSLKPEAVDDAVDRSLQLRRRLGVIPVVTIADANDKAVLNERANEELEALKTVADLVSGCALRAELPGQSPLEDQVAASVSLVAAALDPHEPPELREAALDKLGSRARGALDAGRPHAAPHRNPLHWPLAFPEVFVDREQTGFDAIVGNPPFLGGKRISGAVGTDFREFLVQRLAAGTKGSADLVSYFFLRSAQISRGFGLLATNTISQGDTREVGLERLTASGWVIHRAVKSTPWPGESTLEVAKVWMCRTWNGPCELADIVVANITPMLEPVGRTSGAPLRLQTTAGFSHYGSIVHGAGFLLDPDLALQMIKDDPRLDEVLYPYLVGEDLNNSPRGSASRYVINFGDLPADIAKERYPSCFRLVLERVKPERDRVRRAAYRERWWQFAERQQSLYAAVENLERVLVIAQTSKIVLPLFVPKRQVFSSMVVVFAYEDDFHLGVLTSSIHWWWTLAQSSTLETRIRYTPTDCFQTFPQPPYSATLESRGRALDVHRSGLMVHNNEGLTKTYNRVHNPADDSPGIPELREMHVAVDIAARDAYAWSDLDLDHGFHDTPQGLRFTFGPTARGEVLDRLLELNHQRYADEVAAGLHETRAKKQPTKKRSRQKENLL
jgi:hypothetical protein